MLTDFSVIFLTPKNITERVFDWQFPPSLNLTPLICSYCLDDFLCFMPFGKCRPCGRHFLYPFHITIDQQVTFFVTCWLEIRTSKPSKTRHLEFLPFPSRQKPSRWRFCHFQAVRNRLAGDNWMNIVNLSDLTLLEEPNEDFGSTCSRR